MRMFRKELFPLIFLIVRLPIVPRLVISSISYIYILKIGEANT